MNGDPLASLRKGELSPLYWIFGKERFLVERALGLLKERLLEPATRDFNYDLYHAKEAVPQAILAAARTLPMMARRRLVVVRDADSLDARQLESFAPYLATPVPETCLVLLSDKLDQRTKFSAAFKRAGVLIKLDPLPDRQLPGFVRSEGAARGLRFGAGAAESIAEEVGADLGQIVDALERLDLYVGERKEIRCEDIEAVVATTRQRSVFELADAIGAGDAARALSTLGSLLGGGEAPLKLLAMIGRTVRQLIVVRELTEQRVGRAALAERLALPPFVVEKLEAQARRFDRERLRVMHGAIYQADRTLKSSRLEGQRVMELLVLGLVQATTERSRRASAG